MTPLTTYSDSAAAFAYMSRTNLRFMYSLRDGYKNLSYVHANVLAARDSPSLFSYWAADEPDGWQDPFHLPLQAHKLLKALDPYHPTTLTLNCQDYFFPAYSLSVDFLMTDPYPIGINATYSKWGTPCNASYGDCGCDNCAGTVQDVPGRLDDYAKYERWLGRLGKTKVLNPQAFWGEGYWMREPSVEESWVMVLLGVNHGAKGMVAWVWPTSAELGRAHGELARVLTGEEAAGFVVAGQGPRRIGAAVVDVACWVKAGRMLVSVVNGGYVDVERVEVPVGSATVIESVPWGNVEWRLEGGRLSVPLLPALATSLVVLQLRG
ncbi:hypothetical protein VTI74DRAFT_8681 [Chaetomium olivicolor]